MSCESFNGPELADLRGAWNAVAGSCVDQALRQHYGRDAKCIHARLKAIESDMELLENAKENLNILSTVTIETQATLFVTSRQLEKDSQITVYSRKCMTKPIQTLRISRYRSCK